MKWSHVKQLLEYFQDHSTSDFQDLVDILSSLDAEEIEEYDERFKRLNSKFFSTFLDAVISFSKFEQSVEYGGLTGNNYVNKRFIDDGLGDNIFYMDIFDDVYMEDMDVIVKEKKIGLNQKFISHWIQFKNIRNKLKHLFKHDSYKVMFTAQEFKKHEEIFNQFIQCVQTLSTYDLKDNLDANISFHKFIITRMEYLYDKINRSIKHLITSNTYFTTNLYRSEVFQNIQKLSSIYIPYSFSQISSNISDIYHCLYAIFGDVDHHIDNSFDDLSDLRFSDKKLALFKQIEQRFVEIAEKIDII